jgi:AcrR family transcriptional regulator
MSPRPRRIDQQANLQEAIKETTWKQITEFGAAALSLRAIARELNITAPAIYNYYPSRDDLVTALIVDAFTALGESQRTVTTPDLVARLADQGLMYRQWAISSPQRYQLIFGTPIPGYHAPEELTNPAAAAALSPLVETIQAGFLAKRFRVPRAPLTAALMSMLEAWQKFIGGADLEVLYAALVTWSRVHGLVSLELGGHIPPFITDPGEVFRREIENLIGELTRSENV